MYELIQQGTPKSYLYYILTMYGGVTTYAVNTERTVFEPRRVQKGSIVYNWCTCWERGYNNRPVMTRDFSSSWYRLGDQNGRPRQHKSYPGSFNVW